MLTDAQERVRCVSHSFQLRTASEGRDVHLISQIPPSLGCVAFLCNRIGDMSKRRR